MMNYVPTSTSYKHKTHTDSIEGGTILRQGYVPEKSCANRTQSSHVFPGGYGIENLILYH
jgi:hypothetical protein